ncbi:MAG: beta-N-acetylhexosaminidase [Flaviaesturariibacter sp.]|nr:beta-N-acetylhexosaminidase [Flaviaesturariibacter sp.]
MKRVCFSLLLSWFYSVGFGQTISIIPQPVSVVKRIGSFKLSPATVLVARDAEDKNAAVLFNNYLFQSYGFKLPVMSTGVKNVIRLTTKKFIQKPDKDAYGFTVSAQGILIEGDTYAGTFYGLQTLLQLLPPEAKGKILSIPFVTITDYARFAYRGMHLDVSRHFFPVSFVKKYIDYLALHKMNTFHWHLTDDQGWRIEIKKHPELTKTGAWRDGTIIGRYPGTGNDNTRYGGFYTQTEVKEVVQYAMQRHINVIPEIEMPGHASAAIATYPFLSCFPGEETVIPTHPSLGSQQKRGKKVQETWGVFEDVFCAGKDSTFAFLQDVLDEVVPLFPSPFIHIGGDESPKANWKRCPQCQARMRANGLKDEHELQSYFIQRMERYLKGKGKTIIGWDEILEGGLAPNAVVMSWQGEAGGVAAAKQSHTVIMTPQKPVYFDFSQTRNEDSLVIGGYNSLEAVYAYEPVPAALDSGVAHYILGAQANLWTEYIPNERKVEYMILPRMSALSEVLWSAKASRDWSDFEKRLPAQMKRYEKWKANYSKAYFDITTSLLPTVPSYGLQVQVKPRDKKGIVTYLVEGDHSPIEYTSPIILTKSQRIKINYYRDSRLMSGTSLDIHYNKATGKKVSITAIPNSKYPGQGGAFSLVNGIYSNKGLSYPDWLGFIGDDIEAIIDLDKTDTIHTVRLHTLDQNGSWVYLPQYVEVATSMDGINFTPLGRSSEFVKDVLTMGWITVKVPAQKGRFVKVVAKNYGLIPEGKPGGGTKAWLFADEIQID